MYPEHQILQLRMSMIRGCSRIPPRFRWFPNMPAQWRLHMPARNLVQHFRLLRLHVMLPKFFVLEVMNLIIQGSLNTAYHSIRAVLLKRPKGRQRLSPGTLPRSFSPRATTSPYDRQTSANMSPPPIIRFPPKRPGSMPECDTAQRRCQHACAQTVAVVPLHRHILHEHAPLHHRTG
jgi:hypothetical protein